jgi:multiple sugar transport system substrate-binding protein
MKNYAAAMLIGLLASIGLASPAMSAEPLEIWARTTTANFLPKIVDAFNASHKTQVKLNMIPPAEIIQKFGAASAAGTAPQAVVLDIVQTPAFAHAGELMDITDWAKSLPYFNQLSPAHVRHATYKGRIYGVPFDAENSILLYNKKLFRAAGLDPDKPPRNWAEITDAAVKITALGGGKFGYYYPGAASSANAFEFIPFIWATGGDILSEDGIKATIDTPALRAAIAFYRDLKARKVLPPSFESDTGTDALTEFAAGNIGITPGGGFSIGILLSKYPDIDFGVTTIPGKDGNFASYAGGDNFVITKNAKDLDAIKEFIGFAHSLEGQKLLAKGGSIPIRRDLAAAALSESDPRYAAVIEAQSHGRTPYSIAHNAIISSTNSPWGQLMQEAILTDDVDGAIMRAQKSFQSILDRAQSN